MKNSPVTATNTKGVFRHLHMGRLTLYAQAGVNTTNSGTQTISTKTTSPKVLQYGVSCEQANNTNPLSVSNTEENRRFCCLVILVNAIRQGPNSTNPTAHSGSVCSNCQGIAVPEFLASHQSNSPSSQKRGATVNITHVRIKTVQTIHS
eukprot:TRINITY_DN85299_c0_g1_i1.p2 TRINITY_DN85299_c0_g1~~TRINITY_DN85299_c0_g1_i1.p2  ORF type:complete len:149 (+),score=1.52 TRINITY_DN85299_c0_g1_i1:248-694(+)